jgi:uncharacterized NAD(P)/FAD-binding protein YdhS
MPTDPPNFDLAIIGGGLSGSLLTVDLLERPAGQRPLRIFNCDRDGAFGRGVPYGERHAQPGFLLIEPVAQSTPPEFQRWLAQHAAHLARAAIDSEDAALRAWAADNLPAILAGKFDGLFVPRRWFGQFMHERHTAVVARAAASGAADVTLMHGECLGLQPAHETFALTLTGGTTIRAKLVVLAIGNIPRTARASPALEEGYLHDIWQHGYDALARMLEDRSASLRRALDVKLIGSGATAGEVVYFLAHRPRLLERIRSIEVVSRSGFLAGGGAQLGESTREIRADAAARPAAREYVEASRRLALAGLLSSNALEITGAPRLLGNGRLALAAKSRPGDQDREADVIVNCSGSGDLDVTSSRLLQNMLARGHAFRPNRLNAGFELRDRFETAHVPGCFVLGPLLNQEAVETHVESILGVYRAVEGLAPVLHARLMATLSSGGSHHA